MLFEDDDEEEYEDDYPTNPVVAQQTVADRQVLFEDIQALAQNKLKSDLDLSFAQANLDQAKQLLLQTENAVGEAFAELSAALRKGRFGHLIDRST